jgi:gas vesicle protein
MEKSEELRATLWEKIEAIKEFFEGLKEKWNDVKETIALKIDELHQKWEDFKTAVSEKIERIKEFFQNLKDKWDEVVEGVRAKIEEAKDFLQGLEDKVGNVKDAVVNFFNGMWSGITGAINSIIGGIQSIISWCQSAINWLKNLISWRNSAGSGSGSSGSGSSGYSSSGSFGGTTVNSRGFSGTSGKFAEGGFPEEGQLFLAREAGPELVGTIGGQTAVANNPDIVAAIEGGVYRAMVSSMSSTSENESKVAIFNMNGREFMRAIWNDRNAVIAEYGMSLIND